MQDIYSKAEQASRWEFSYLFCGPVLSLCPTAQAINKESWTDLILDTILHSVFPNNVLTTEKIKAIRTILGWSEDKLYFKLPPDIKRCAAILPHIQSFITLKTYLKARQDSNAVPENTTEKFLKQLFATSGKSQYRYPFQELYRIYQYWCTITCCEEQSRKQFLSTLQRYNIHTHKGYCNGRSGITYCLINHTPEEVLDNVKKEEEEEEEQNQTECIDTSSWDNSWRRAENTSPNACGEKEGILEEEVEHNKAKEAGISKSGDVSYDEELCSQDEAVESEHEPRITQPSKDNNSNTSDTDNIDAFIPINIADESHSRTDVADKSETISNKTDPTNLLGRLKHLEPSFRDTFEQLRLYSKGLIQPVSYDEFTEMIVGFNYTEEQKLSYYALLLEYVDTDLRKLKKGENNDK